METEKTNNDIILEARKITKIFSGTKVLDDVSFVLKKGQIHCLCGENGAGKSTLIKVLSGAYIPDGGSVIIDGEDYKNHLTPLLAKKQGIEVIHQEIILVSELSVAENVYTDVRYRTAGFFSMKKTCEAVTKLMDELGLSLNPYEKVGNLSAAEQQFVKILKALAPNPKVLIMDEPTAMFNMKDSDMVLNLVKDISKRGIGIIYISHHLKEIKQIADTVTVLRDGKTVASHDGENLNLDQIAADMVGRPIEMFYKREHRDLGDVVMEVKGLKVEEDSQEINFALRKGEILGITGMVGSGRSEIIRAIYGLDKRAAGDIYINGEKISIKNPCDCINHNIGYISEDRQSTGLILPLNILMNTTFLNLPRKGAFLDLKKEYCIAKDAIDKLNVKTTGPQQLTCRLSGGNQQKVIIGKWLHKGFDILILDEPTKGIDVNAKFEIYKLLNELTKQGKSILIVSSDMPEIVSLCNRVLIVRNGAIQGEVKDDEISEERLIKIAVEVN